MNGKNNQLRVKYQVQRENMFPLLLSSIYFVLFLCAFFGNWDMYFLLKVSNNNIKGFTTVLWTKISVFFFVNILCCIKFYQVLVTSLVIQQSTEREIAKVSLENETGVVDKYSLKVESSMDSQQYYLIQID